jgi:hypothetical protein
MKTKTLSVMAVVALGAGLSACDTGTGDRTAAASETVNEKAELVYSFEVEANHHVDFYLLATGDVAVNEQRASTTQVARLAQTREMQSLAATFEAVAPGATVPAVLVDADARARARREALALSEVGLPPKPAGESMFLQPEDRVADELVSEDVSTKRGAIVACSSDYYGDNWSSKWFLDNFCYARNLPYRYCDTNLPAANITSGYKSKLTYDQFEGDFNNAGNVDLYGRKCVWTIFFGWDCYYVNQVHTQVRPRGVSSWSWGGSDSGKGVKVVANSPCNHLGYVFNYDY